MESLNINFIIVVFVCRPSENWWRWWWGNIFVTSDIQHCLRVIYCSLIDYVESAFSCRWVRSAFLSFVWCEVYAGECQGRCYSQSLVMVLVFSRVEFDAVTFTVLPKQLLDRLQSVQNAAAWLICLACSQDHIQPHFTAYTGPAPWWISFPGPHPASLHSLHWSSSMIDFVPVGGAAVSLRPQLCSQLSSISVFLTREDVSTRCNTDCACYHRWPHLPGSCCVWNSLLETVCACCLTASSFPQ